MYTGVVTIHPEREQRAEKTGATYRFNLYPAEKFGLYGEPDVDESYVVMVRLDERGIETKEAYSAYLYMHHVYEPPCIDLGSMCAEDLSNRPPGLMPTFHQVTVDSEGEMTFTPPGKVWNLTEEQQDLLAMPLCINTEKGPFWLTGEEERKMVLEETLECVPAKTLNRTEFNRALEEKYPAMLKPTHIQYGNRFPTLPCGKYFMEQRKAVIFVAASQLKEIPEEVLKGNTPYFVDAENDEEWNRSNTYGICVVDDRSEKYSVKLIPPDKLLEFRDRIVREEKGLEKTEVR